MRGRWFVPGLLVLIVAGACGGGSKATPTSAGSETATATAATATASAAGSPATLPPASATAPETILGVPVRRWTVNPPESPPAGSSWLLVNSCTNCGGGIDSLDRITVSSDVVISERLFESSSSEYIFGVNAAPDGKEVWLNTCSRGYCGYEDKPSPGAQSTIRHSLDGGRSWQVVRILDGPSRMVGGPGNWWLDLSWFGDGSWTWKFERYPSGEAFEPPADVQYPVVDAREGLLWVTNQPARVIGADGRELVSASLIAQITGAVHPSGLVWFGGTLPGGDLFLQWSRAAAPAIPMSYLGRVHDGKLVDVIGAEMNGAGGDVSVWTGDGRGYGNASLWPGDIPGTTPAGERDSIAYSMPAFVDYGAASITPITLLGPPYDQAYFGRSNRVLGVDLGSSR